MKKKKIIVFSIIAILLIALGITYAMFTYNSSSTNSKLVVGDIYMKYKENNSINFTNAMPTNNYIANQYFEFEITGKNTNTEKDIIYDIVLAYGDDHGTRNTRIRDDLLKFRLVTVSNNVETELFTDESYDSIDNKRIYAATIEKNTTNEITTTYRLYAWISDETVIGNVNQDYTETEWNDVYASVKVNVTGDFSSKTIDNRLRVTFDATGGTTPTASKSVTVNSPYGNLPTPTRNGYTFVNWGIYELPVEYQEVEYIEFTGTQYIDTEIIPTNHMTEIKFNFDTYESDEHLFGTSLHGAYYHFTAYSNKYFWGRNGSETSAGSWTTGIHTLIYNGDNNSVILDDNILDSGYNIASTYTLWIGRRQGAANLKGKVYYMKINNKETGQLERNLVPCYRIDDDVRGFYDLVEGKFYTDTANSSTKFKIGSNIPISNSKYHFIVNNNSIVTKEEDHTLYAIWQYNPIVTFDATGGTTPTASKSVTVNSPYGNLPTPIRNGYTFVNWGIYELPVEYQEVEYIEFTENQYIDTELIPSNHMTEIKFNFDEYNNDEHLFGTMSGSNYYHFTAYSNKYFWGRNGTETSGGSWTTGIHTLIYNGDNNSVILDDNILDSGYNIASTSNLWIGRRQISANLKGKVYYMKITNKETGQLERNLVPCYRIDDDVRGFYDLVEGKFYTDTANSSTKFKIGSNIPISNSKYHFIVNNNSIVTKEEDHTLYAIWEEE